MGVSNFDTYLTKCLLNIYIFIGLFINIYILAILINKKTFENLFIITLIVVFLNFTGDLKPDVLINR
jgi:hypothetical protein